MQKATGRKLWAMVNEAEDQRSKRGLAGGQKSIHEKNTENHKFYKDRARKEHHEAKSQKD